MGVGGRAAQLAVAQLGLLSSYNPLTVLIMLLLQSISRGFHVCGFSAHWLHGRMLLKTHLCTLLIKMDAMFSMKVSV